MSGVTVPLGFPYPDDADLVQGVDEAIQSLAEAVDDSIAGAAAAATAGASVTLPGGSHVYRRGQVGILRISAWTLTALKGAGSQLALLPVGFRPVADTYFIVYNHVGVTFNFGVVEADGDVLIGNAQASGSALYASVAFPL